MAAVSVPAERAGDLDIERARESIRAATLLPEAQAIAEILERLRPHKQLLANARTRAMRWVSGVRAERRERSFAGSLMEQFPLDSPQGRALMSLAEALLRTPDPVRADQLIAERLAEVHSAGVAGSDDLLLRAGFALLGLASHLLPDAAGELSGDLSPASFAKPVVAPLVRGS